MYKVMLFVLCRMFCVLVDGVDCVCVSGLVSVRVRFMYKLCR